MRKMTGVQKALCITFLIIVWGVNWPLSKYALNNMPPVLFSGIRTLLGGLILLGFTISRLKQLQFKRTWPIYTISAVLNVVLYYGLQTIGLGYLPSGLFSAIVFLQPVLVGLFSWLWLGESMNSLKVIGLILGFSGVAVICCGSGGNAGQVSLIGILFALGTALSWALGIVFVRKTSGNVDHIWLVTVQLLIGGGFMTAIGANIEKWSDVVWSPAFIINLLFISIFVIALGWLLFYRLMDSGDASKVASFTFLVPLVAILTGCFFFNEPFTISLFVGLILILISLYFVNRHPFRQVAVKELS